MLFRYNNGVENPSSCSTTKLGTVNLSMIGLIFMIAGVVWFVVGLLLGFTKRSTTTTEKTVGTGVNREREIHTEDR